MKKISVLFFWPLLVFGQPTENLQIDLAYVDFNMEVNVQLEHEEELNYNKPKDHGIADLAKMNIPVIYEEENVVPMTSAIRNIPKHLSTLSLTRQALEKHQSFAPQKRLDYMLTKNSLEFPKEDSLLKIFSPVRYKNAGFGGAENMPEGFGPRIRL